MTSIMEIILDVSLDMGNAICYRCFTAYHSFSRLKYVAFLQAMDWLDITVWSAMFVDKNQRNGDFKCGSISIRLNIVTITYKLFVKHMNRFHIKRIFHKRYKAWWILWILMLNQSGVNFTL